MPAYCTPFPMLHTREARTNALAFQWWHTTLKDMATQRPAMRDYVIKCTMSKDDGMSEGLLNTTYREKATGQRQSEENMVG